MDIFIYFYSKMPTALGTVEDTLDELLAGEGEVTGSGTGESGSHIDIEIFEKDPAVYIEPFLRVLKRLKMPNDTVIELHGKQYSLAKIIIT